MKTFLSIFTVCTLAMSAVNAQTQPKVQYFPLQDVRLLDSPFKQAQQTDMNYILALQPDRLLAPYLREAGLTPKAESYTNWENTGLDGHIGGHYLSALAMMYASTGDREMLDRLNYMLNELQRAQDAVGTGFLGGTPGSVELWSEIKEGKIDAGGFSLNGRWVPLYNIHKIYAGLRDAYLFAGSEQALAMLRALTDWMIDITASLTDAQIQDMLRSEHGGLNETFADLYAITKEAKYLELAQRFSEMVILNPLMGSQDHLTGMHANTQIPKVIGYKAVADQANDAEWDKGCRYFWDRVVNHRSVCIGGNSVREHFHPETDFTPMLLDIEGPETCNTYNMLRLTKQLYQSTPELAFADYYERGLYNHILSSQEPEKGGFVYFTPMRPGHYRVYSQPETSMWCCVGSGLENHAKYGEFIYAYSGDSLYVNLFIPSTLDWKKKGLILTQETAFPNEEEIRFRIKQAPKKAFTLLLRYPSWSKGAQVIVNGKLQDIKETPNGYIAINRKWKKDDRVSLLLPMELAMEQILDQQDYYAFTYGPIVLATATGTNDLQGLFADDSRGGHIAHGCQIPLQDVPMLIGNVNDMPAQLKRLAGDQLAFEFTGNVYPQQSEPLTFIPFYNLHQSRYEVYCHVVDEAEFKGILQEVEAREAAATALANRTVDVIYPGEQQPESDHHIRFEVSTAGVHHNRHFRKADGWFSYELKIKDSASEVALKLHQSDVRPFGLLFNGELLQAQPMESADADGFITAIYPIPNNLLNDKNTLRIQSDGQGSTPAIYEVRIMK